MSNWEIEYTVPEGMGHGRFRYNVYCSWGYPEFIKSLMVNPNVNIQSYYDMWEGRGLTAEVFEERKIQAGCVGPQCSDPNTFWNKEECDLSTMKPVAGECYCTCKNGYTHDGEKCVKAKQKATSDSESPPFTPAQILLGVGIGTTILVAMSLMIGGEKNDESI